MTPRPGVLLILLLCSGCIPECGQHEQFAKLDLQGLRDAARQFQWKVGRWPSKVGDLMAPGCNGDECQLEGPRTVRDPWGGEYLFEIADCGLRISSSTHREIAIYLTAPHQGIQ